MKTTDSVVREKFDIEWHTLTCDLFDLMSKAGFVRTVPEVNVGFCRWEERVKALFSHSLAEARREVDENWNKRLLRLEDKIFYTSSSKEALQAVKDMRASFTGDNPEEAK